jgi:glycosyltransferase
MVFSIITSVYNNKLMISQAINSVASQLRNNVTIEHIIIDGNSTDGTKEYLIGSKLPIHVKFKSESDQGIYDALQKGFLMASGDVVGILHSDDFFSDENVLSDIQNLFEQGADVVYGDLIYVDRATGSSVIRDWRAGSFTELDLKMGWMPPHPTFFFRRDLLKSKGHFCTSFRIAGDYEYMLRFLTDSKLKIMYCNRTITHMRAGGVSNRSLKNILKKMQEDFTVAKLYFDSPMNTVLFKNLRKISQLRIFNRSLCQK